jgi:rhodanese-related sulfurtransferase
MPSYRETLGEKGIEDVVSYLWSLPRVVDALAATRPPPIPLGPVPLNPKGPEPRGFQGYPKLTSVAVVSEQLARKARMVVADARVPSDYERGHIAGAVSIPFYEPEPYFAKLPKSTWIVCYCGCPHAESGSLAQKLTLAGFTKVTVMDEGLWEWQNKGHPMHEGRAP